MEGRRKEGVGGGEEVREREEGEGKEKSGEIIKSKEEREEE